MKKGRGVLHKDAQKVAQKHLGRDITRVELRLVPYIHYVMTNEQRIDPLKCNRDDRDILEIWREEGHIEGGASGLSITREFWDFMCELLWETYVIRN